MEKLKPAFALVDIKAAFADPAVLNSSFVSKQGVEITAWYASGAALP